MNAIMVDDTAGTTGLEGGFKKQEGGASGANQTGAPQSGAPVPASGAQSGELKNDIAKILKEVQLPERRDAKGAADTQPSKQIEISPLLSDTPVQSATPKTLAPEPEKPQAHPEDTEVEKKDAAASGPQSPVVALHTLRDDLKGVVREKKISVVRAAALEQEKRGTPERIPESNFGGRVRSILFTVFLLSLLGTAALGGVYYFVSRDTPAPTLQTNDSLVFAEKTIAFPLDDSSPSTLKAQLAGAKGATGASLGTITRIVPVVTDTTSGTPQLRPATLSEFLSALDIQLPDELARALSQQFFLGIHTVDKNAPVLVVPVLSYDHAFAGMLAWEKTMNASLSPLFTPVSPLVTVDGIPTERTFKDDVFRNYDVRTLADNAGSTVLYYSFPTRNVVIIAESPYTFTEILTRLQALNNL